MNKEAIKAFIAWLENATEIEINQRIDEIYQLERSGRLSSSGMADLKLARRLIDEELIARLELSQSSAITGGEQAG